MENVIDLGLSAAAAVVAFALFWLSYRAFQKGARRKSLLVLVVAAFILRLSASWFFCLHSWDERLHAVVASHMMQDPLRPTLIPDPVRPYNVDNWLENHVWLHKPPMTMWLMALSMKVLGKNEVTARLPSVVLGSLAPLLTFSLALLIFPPMAAWFAAFFHAINGFLIELESGRASTDHTDALMVFFVLLAFFLGTRFLERKKIRWLVFCGLATGVSILTKWWTGLLVPALVVLLLLEEEGWIRAFFRGMLLAAFCVLVVLPWEIYTRRVFPEEVHAITLEHLTHFSNDLGHPGGPFFHLLKMLPHFGFLVYPAVGWFLWRMWREWKEGRRRQSMRMAVMFLWLAVPYFVFSLAAAKMSGLVMISAPAVFLMLGGFLCFLLEKLPETQDRYRRYLLRLAVAALILAPVQYTLERTKVFRKLDRYPAFGQELRNLAGKVPGEGKAVIFNVPWPLEAMFYVPFSVYGDLPGPEEVKRLAREGYRIYVYTRGEPVRDDLNGRPEVRLLEPGPGLIVD